MVDKTSFNSKQFVQKLLKLFKNFKKLHSYSTHIKYIGFKKILDFCIEDNRWIYEPSLTNFKNATYLKINELIQTHKDKPNYIRYFNFIKIHLRFTEKEIVYTQTKTYIEHNFQENKEFELLYGENVQNKEFELLYGENVQNTEFELLYGENVQDTLENKEFELLYGENVQDTLKNKEFENLYQENDQKNKKEEFKKLYEENAQKNKKFNILEELDLYKELKSENDKYNFNKTKNNINVINKIIDLSTLSQPCISIANICPIICRL
jgi:hypothetical protein